MDITKYCIAFVRVHNTEDGESHLEEIEYSLATTNHGLIAENVAVEEVVLRAWHENSEEPQFHVSPRRQFVIHLSARLKSRRATVRRGRCRPAASCWPRTPRARGT